MRSAYVATLALGVIASVPAVAGAGIATFRSNTATSTDMLGSYVGTASYASLTPNTGTLVIQLTNTSPIAGGGYITGLVFNVPGSDSSASLFSANPSAFTSVGTNPSASPFGSFEAGAALGGNFLGGGSPVPGIAVGSTGTFIFSITSSVAATITADDFVPTSAIPSLVVRFRGFANGGSDKVPGIGEPPIPAPGAAATLALAGGFLIRRRRR